MAACNNKFDLTGMSVCAQAAMVYTAYMKALTGGQRVRIKYAEQETEYRKATSTDMDRLRDLYMSLRGQCANKDDLPDISKSASGPRRGPPGRVYC